MHFEFSIGSSRRFDGFTFYIKVEGNFFVLIFKVFITFSSIFIIPTSKIVIG